MRLILITMVLFLSGCSATQVPVVLQAVNESGEITETIATTTGDASVEKERQVHNTLRNRDKEYGKAYALSGLNLKFKMQEVIVQGVTVYVQIMEELNFKEMPEFTTDLPIEPSVHPVWAAATSIGKNLINGVLIGYGINQAAGVLNGAISGAGTVYHGDFNATNSVNSAGTNQAFDYSYAPIMGE